jgi:ubiquitin-protein ligase
VNLPIHQEITSIQRNHDLCQYITSSIETLLKKRTAIAVACNEKDVRDVKALIIGPAGTPYEFGFFEVRCLKESLCFI